MSLYEDELTDEVSFDETGTDYYQSVSSELVADAFVLWRNEVFYAQGASASEGIGISQADIQNIAITIGDIIFLSDSQALKQFFNSILTENTRVTDTLLPGLVAVLQEGIGSHDAVNAAYAMALIDNLGLTDALTPSFKYALTIRDTARWMDSLANFFAGIISEGIGVNDAPANKLFMYPALTDNVGVAEALTQKLVFRVTAADTVALDDFDIEQLRYAATIAEGIEIAAGYIGPNGQFTTWAINTKNFATTEYTNYEFNSFAQMGNQFLGASSTGLYELDGDTDNGAAIIADIKSGLMQLGGSRFTSFKAAYLGVRGSGDFVLKLETGDGKFYTYAVVGKNMQTTKVHLGKGLRARYFSFELISTGQDFDLDTVEFIPLIAERRD